MKEPYESMARPSFTRQIREIWDLKVGDWLFAVNRIDHVSISLMQIKSFQADAFMTCRYFPGELGEYVRSVSLRDSSILPYKDGMWNCSNFLISAGEQRTPLTKEESQALIAELGITPLPSNIGGDIHCQ